jgi:hypothetical protein
VGAAKKASLGNDEFLDNHIVATLRAVAGCRVNNDDKSCDLLEVCISLPGRSVTLDVDFVYGLVELTSEIFGVVPDYSLPTAIVFADVSRRYLAVKRLHDAGWVFAYTPLRKRCLDLPSWAIHWTMMEDLAEFSTRRMLMFVQRLHADDWVSSVHLSRNSHVEFSGDMMLLRGVYLDNITEVGDSTAMLEGFFIKTDDWVVQANVIRTWHHLAFSQHAPSDTYCTPLAFAQEAQYD